MSIGVFVKLPTPVMTDKLKLNIPIIFDLPQIKEVVRVLVEQTLNKLKILMHRYLKILHRFLKKRKTRVLKMCTHEFQKILQRHS